MGKLTIIARISVKPEKIDFFKSEAVKLIAPTRKEPGCLQYDLHQDNNNPAYFIFYENWENRELWQVHMNNPLLKAYLEAIQGSIEESEINEMTQI